MCRNIEGRLNGIVSAREDVAVANDDCSDRHVAGFGRLFGLLQGQSHESLVIALHDDRC
jgi:hypothetical protein